VKKFGDVLMAASDEGIWYWKNAEELQAKKLFADKKLGKLKIYCILKDRKGQFWASTNAGIYRFRLEHPHYEAYLTHVEFNKRSSAYLQDSLYFGSINGLYVFHPDAFPPLPPVASHRITHHAWVYGGVAVFSMALLACIFFFYKKWRRTEQQLIHTLQKGKANDAEQTPLIERLESFIENNLADVTVVSLSAFSGLSLRSLYRFLQDNYGTTPGDLILNIRIKKARELVEGNPHLRKEELGFHTGLSMAHLNNIVL
jgi:hypothetical protein